MPQIATDNGDLIEVVEEIKLLGIVIKSDLKWNSNTNLLCERKLWMIRNLKKFNPTGCVY